MYLCDMKRAVIRALAVAMVCVWMPGMEGQETWTRELLRQGESFLMQEVPLGAASAAGEALRLALMPGSSEAIGEGVVGVAQRALLTEAMAQTELPGGEPLALLRRYLELYPTSGRVGMVRLAIGDVYYDRGQWAEAYGAYAAVDPATLGREAEQRWRYHSGFCDLKMARYAEASGKFYKLLGGRGEMAGAAAFYLGYIEYIEGRSEKAMEYFGRSEGGSGMPCGFTAYYQAQCLFAMGDYAGALEKAKYALGRRIEPLGASAGVSAEQYRGEALRIAGESAYALGGKEEALGYLREYVEGCEAPMASALYIVGVEEYDKGEYLRAITTLTGVSGEGNAMGQSANLYIGLSYLEIGDASAALLALEKASAMDADRGVQEEAYYNYAVAKTRGARVPFGSSVGVMEEFLRRYPGSRHAGEVREYVVRGYMTDNNYEAALEALEGMRDATPGLEDAKQRVLYVLGSRELQQGKREAALEHLRQATEMTADAGVATEARLWYGEALYGAGKYGEAAEQYRKYLNAKGGRAEQRGLAYYDLGYALIGQREYVRAREAFEKALRGDKRFTAGEEADIYNRMGDCRYYGGDFSGAASEYQRAYEAEPGRGDYALYRKGVMQGLERDHGGKIATLGRFRREFGASPLMATVLLEMGQSYAEMGEVDKAIATYGELAERYGGTSAGRQGTLLLAMTYLAEGEREKAKAGYRKVIEAWPTSGEALTAAEDLRQLMAEEGELRAYQRWVSGIAGAPTLATAEVAALQMEALRKAFEGGRDADAQAMAAELIEEYPDSREAVSALGIKAELQSREGDVRGAMASYQEMEAKASEGEEVAAARMGILRMSQEVGQGERAIEYAERLLNSSVLGPRERREVLYTKAMALKTLGKNKEACTIWTELAADRSDQYGAKSSCQRAQYLFETSDRQGAQEEINRLIDSGTPEEYWLARGFILLSDIKRAEGKKYEADEYLRSLRANYPGKEPDIFSLIDERLPQN